MNKGTVESTKMPVDITAAKDRHTPLLDIIPVLSEALKNSHDHRRRILKEIRMMLMKNAFNGISHSISVQRSEEHNRKI
ncbi:MAG: hypothetical protein ACOYVJ_11460 [Nitrospirota bacterium]